MRNPHAPVKEIVKLLHKYQIPLSLLNNVFDLVRIDIEQNSIPYNPDSPNAGALKENAVLKEQRDDDPMSEDVVVSYKTKRACINCKNYFTHCKNCKYGAFPKHRFINGVQDGCQIGPI